MCGKIATQPSKRNPTKNRAIDHAEPWRGADLVRVVQQIVKLHALGPRLLFEFLAELAADFVVRDDIEHLLFRWADINSRVALMRRFAEMEAEGKQCILLYCGDHDPGGLAISDHLRPNLECLANAVGWEPNDLVIDRFGLNIEFIERERLSWIENLETSSGGNLNDTRHKDHRKPYVQEYIEQFGARKVEANALVTRVEAGRKLCREAILEYLDEDDPEHYRAALETHQEKAREAITELFSGWAAQ